MPITTAPIVNNAEKNATPTIQNRFPVAPPTKSTTMSPAKADVSSNSLNPLTGFENRIPVFTQNRMITRPSMLDTLSESSEIRKSLFWGFAKFVSISMLYWVGAGLYNQYHNREYMLDSNFANSLMRPFIQCMIWWVSCHLWTVNGHLNIYMTLAFGSHWWTKLHLWTAEATMLILSVYIPVRLDDTMGAVSAGFTFAVGQIYMMKLHSYTETNYDLISLDSEEKPFVKPTIYDLAYFLVAPTLIYEPDFPRSEKLTRKRHILYRTCILAFTLLVFYVWVTEHTIPVLVQLHRFTPIESIIRCFIPIWTVSMIVFFVMFEIICNLLADIVSFGDRQFYGDWWNSTTYEEFNRRWNKPVHEYLLRHVYFKCQARGHSKFLSQVATVFYSACLHELALYTITKRLKFYFLTLMMVQPTLFKIQNRIGMKGTMFGNYFFWASLVFGLSISTTSYTRDWARDHEQANIALGWLAPAMAAK